MAVAQQTTTPPPTMQPTASAEKVTLRRVAIVLGSLPTSVASGLIASLSAETKQRVREEIRGLADVDPLERHRAFQAFKGSFRRESAPDQGVSQHTTQAGDTFVSAASQPSAPPTGMDVDVRGDRRQVPRTTSSELDWQGSAVQGPATGDLQSRPEMDFLGDIEDAVLARVIQDEHPQAVAFVLASIAPAQAARIVTTLDPKLQSEALNRIARLDEASDDAIADFADHLRQKVERFGATPRVKVGTTGGKFALQAILDAMPKQNGMPPTHAAPESRHHDHSVDAAHLAGDATAGRQLNVVGDSDHPDDRRASNVDQVMSPRIAAGTLPDSDAFDELSADPRNDRNDSVADVAERRSVPMQTNTVAAAADKSMATRAFPSTDSIHQHLIQLKPKQLCRALAEVSTRQALLTLCGLPNHVAEAVLAALPRGQAKQVRAKLGSLGSLQLREIDEAKELVALVSIGRSPSQASHTNTNDPTHSIPIAA